MPNKNKLSIHTGIPDRNPIEKAGETNQQQAVKDFVESYQVNEAKQLLWELVVTALGKSPSVYDEGRARSNLIFFYERLEAMVEAVYVLQAPLRNNDG